jgi:hypothetical protein
MFFYIESKCERSYIAVDDDQTIYTFQGADENIFINLKGDKDPRIESRRVPREIHKIALSILKNIDNRLEKEWKPRDAEGKVFHNQFLDNIDFSFGNWMIIARTNKMLPTIKDRLISLNLRFDCKFNSLDKPIEAYKIWIRLNEGATVGAEEAKKIYKYLNVKNKQIKKNYSLGKSLDKADFVDLDDLRMDHGLLVYGSWEQLNINEDIKLYMKALIANGDNLFSKARIKVSTIHGVKGEECDNVVLFTDLRKVIYEAARVKPNPEHRLFFVGVTRAKENLYIMQPTEEYYYTIGDPI